MKWFFKRNTKSVKSYYSSKLLERMKDNITKIQSDPRYKKNVEYGKPRSGHPEGKIKSHIADLIANLESIKPRLRSACDYWKLLFLIHVHDTFKAEAARNVSNLHPQSHASLARAFASEFTSDSDLLNMIQYHDENYALWKEFRREGLDDESRFQELLSAIDDWNLFLLFIIVDGATRGKDQEKLVWFVQQVRKHKQVEVKESWILQVD